MQARKKYLLLLICCAFLSKVYFGYFHWNNYKNEKYCKSNMPSFLKPSDIFNESQTHNEIHDTLPLRGSASNLRSGNSHFSDYKNCRMETCFDFTLCDKFFKVYIYPIDNNVPPSSNYMKVLKSIQNSEYYTSDPSQACIFVLSLDTFDRDSLSKDFIRNMPPRIERLHLWNNGQNHIIFNMFAGTWPDYSEDLGFNLGKAILAKSSISLESYRPGFDISLPLFLKSHPEVGGHPGMVKSNRFPETKKYLLGFKGKRYLYGIGSETRNSLYHLHNEKDVILVTTCKHGGNWREYKDERCDQDNFNYDRLVLLNYLTLL